MKRVAIVGGGLSGLSAAYQLVREPQVEFTLFEASARLGGIVETVRQRRLRDRMRPRLLGNRKTLGARASRRAWA